MALFGIKKIKKNNTFINNDVINVPEDDNMTSNNIVSYDNSNQDVTNEVVENSVVNTEQAPETFVYSQVDNVNNDAKQADNGVIMTVDKNAFFASENEVAETHVHSDEQMLVVPQEGDNAQEQTTYSSQEASQVVISGVPQEQVVQQSELNNREPGACVPQLEFSDKAQDEAPSQLEEDTTSTQEELVQSDVSQLQSLMFPDKSQQSEVIPVLEEESLTSVFDITKEVTKSEETIKYDPLNNATNPVPVNPTSPEVDDDIIFFDEEEGVKTDVVTVMKMMFGILLKPATVIGGNVKKYSKMFKSLMLMFWVAMFSLVFCLIGRLIAGAFSTTQNAISGASKISLNFVGLFQQSNYIPYILVTIVISMFAILVVSLVYYLSSFIHSKGVHLAVYIALSSLALVPLILSFTLVYPIVGILSTDIAFIFLLFGLVFSIVILVTGINSIVKYKTKDGKILYNAINLTIIFSVMIFIFYTLSELHILELAILIR